MPVSRIHELFDHWLQAEPERVFVHLPPVQGRPSTLNFAQLGRMAAAAEAELRAEGVRSGDRVLLVAENCPEHLALIVACSRVGAWSCGVNARMAPAEVAAFADKADARLSYFTIAASDAAAAHGQRHGATASALPGVVRSPVRSQARAETGALGERVAAVIFTSGTTGASKGVMMTHEGVLQFARLSAASRGLDGSDRSYAYIPMTHIFGLGTVLMSSLLSGASLVMRSQFDPADALDALAVHGVTQFQGPPALYSRLLAHLEQTGVAHPRAPDLRYLYTGAGPLDLSLKRRVEAAFRQALHHGYGLSEYAGALTLTRRGEWRDDTSAGYVVEGAELRIADPVSGAVLPAGERGEVWMRGPGLMAGYFRDPQATAAVMRDGGWYASGDLGEVSPLDGSLRIVGRLKEMIVRSGFNVYPAEVETVLNAFPGIQRCAVVGRPEADGNEAVIAYVELRPGASAPDPDRLRAYLSEHLAPYKRPALVRSVPQLPMTHSGKVLKRQLLEMFPPD